MEKVTRITRASSSKQNARICPVCWERMPYIILDPDVAAWAPFPWAWVCAENGHAKITILDGNIEDYVEVGEMTSTPENSYQKPVNGCDKNQLYAVMSRLIDRAKK